MSCGGQRYHRAIHHRSSPQAISSSPRSRPRPCSPSASSGPAELIVPGSFEVASYTIGTGEKLWWVRGMAWQLKSVPVIDRDRIFVSGWEIGGDQERRTKIPEFAKALAEYDKNHDGKLSHG